MYIYHQNRETEMSMKQQAKSLLTSVDRALADNDMYEAMEFLQAAELLIESLENEKKAKDDNVIVPLLVRKER
jgi:hypothetical protein